MYFFTTTFFEKESFVVKIIKKNKHANKNNYEEIYKHIDEK